jgi:adenosylcobinamide-phosphate synthase
VIAAWELLSGVSLDLALGDPRWLPHPIRAVGWMVTRAELVWRRTRIPLRIAGALMWICVASMVAVAVWMTLPWLTVFWIWTLLALRGLDTEAASVVRALDAGDLVTARAKLSMIVGRDTADLGEAEILRAVVETVSENTNDAVVAPAFYLMIGGPVAMAVYKAANTMDSMVGYRNDRYREFGWFAARMDDAMNFIPARLTAALVWISAFILRLNVRGSVRITLRDARRQPSPNSGYPEAAYAGALGVRLGGLSKYGGVPSHKAHLGDPVRPLSNATFRSARQVLYSTSFLTIAIMLTVLR